MAAWKMKEANDTWEDVCERAYSGEPQYLTRNGVSYRIVISLAQHDAETQKQRSVFETLTSCPCDLSELVAEDGREEVSSFDRMGGFRSWGRDMRYLIDTCAISELSARKPSEDVRRWFASVPDEDLYLSVVTIGELRKGIDRLSEDDLLRQRLERWFSSVRSVFSGRILEFDERMAIAWGKIVGESIRIGKMRPAIDAQLAATALVNGMVLVTRNEKDFEHTGVQVLNPFDEWG